MSVKCEPSLAVMTATTEETTVKEEPDMKDMSCDSHWMEAETSDPESIILDQTKLTEKDMQQTSDSESISQDQDELIEKDMEQMLLDHESISLEQDELTEKEMEQISDISKREQGINVSQTETSEDKMDQKSELSNIKDPVNPGETSQEYEVTIKTRAHPSGRKLTKIKRKTKCGKQKRADDRDPGFDPDKHEKKNKTWWYKCDICGKHVKYLKEHMRSHAGEEPFKCEHCDAAFDQKQSLQTYLGEMPYKCEVCGKGFRGRYNIRIINAESQTLVHLL